MYVDEKLAIFIMTITAQHLGNPLRLVAGIAQRFLPTVPPSLVFDDDVNGRTPMRHYTFLEYDGVIYHEFLNPIPIHHIRRVLISRRCSCQEHENHYLCRLPSGERFKVSFTDDRMLWDLDFSLHSKHFEEKMRIGQAFLNIIHDAGLVDAIFKKNPYFEEERLMYKRYRELQAHPRNVDLPTVAPEELKRSFSGN